MKMRAKMVDGTPVTFESIDHGKMVVDWDARPGGSVRTAHVTEFIGEGLHVQSEWHGQAVHLQPTDTVGEHRMAFDRQALERSGVDTATVEYLDRPETTVTLPEEWFPLWQRAPAMEENAARDRDDAEFLLGMRQTHAGYGQPTEAMIAAGAAGLHDILYSELIVEAGQVRLRDYRGTAILIYETMERARR